MSNGLLAGFVTFVWAWGTLLLAYTSNMLYPEQMRQKYPHCRIFLPSIFHGGLLGDVVLWPFLVGSIVGYHWQEWSALQVIGFGMFGLLLSAIMHWVYTKTPFPDLAWKVEGMTPPAWSHYFFMAWPGFAILGLFFFCSSVTRMEVSVVSIICLFHIIAGNHIPLGLVNETYHFDWCPPFLDSSVSFISVAGVAVLLVLLSFHAAGVWPAIFVAVAAFTAFVGYVAIAPHRKT